jgi:histone-lysine N-methyltransferase SETD3
MANYVNLYQLQPGNPPPTPFRSPGPNRSPGLPGLWGRLGTGCDGPSSCPHRSHSQQFSTQKVSFFSKVSSFSVQTGKVFNLVNNNNNNNNAQRHTISTPLVNMNDHDKARFDALVDWSRQRGGDLPLEVYRDDVTGFSLRNPVQAAPLEPGFVAVVCPLSTTLSFLNALVDGPLQLSSEPLSQPHHPAFPKRFMQSLPPYVIGRFFLIKEYLKGRHSYWWPYLATLPAPEQIAAWALPAFWPEDDIFYLDGTNAGMAIGEIQDNLKREFKQARKILKEDGWPDYSNYTQLLYRWAYSIFSSRSFRPSLVLSPATRSRIASLLPPGCQIDDFSILQPLFDIANHFPTARHTWDSQPTADGAEEACRLICHDYYGPGEQVFNNYGPDKTNSELLLSYGFILPETDAIHNDYIHVRKRGGGPRVDAGRDNRDEESRSGETEQPKDFLISLRPIAHPSSLAAHSRLRRAAAAAAAAATAMAQASDAGDDSATPATSQSATRSLADLPCFAHFEPALVEDITEAIASPEERQALHQWTALSTTNSDGRPEHAVIHAELAGLAAKVREVLARKLRDDLRRLRSVKVLGVHEDGGGEGGDEEEEEGEEEYVLPPPGNRNQQVAVEYRRQCEKVLVAALAGLEERD